MEKELAKLFSVVLIELVLSLFLIFLEQYLSSTAFIVISSLFLLAPIILANDFLTCISYGAISGFTQAIVISAVSSSFLPILAVYLISGVGMGLGYFPFIKSKNIMFLIILFIAFLSSVALNWFFQFYDYNFMFAFQSLFYMFK